MRYRFYTNGNVVVCVSTFAKKNVRGVARCSDTDTFDMATGRDLARMRCDAKIAQRRMDKAIDRVAKAEAKLKEVQEELNNAKDYYRHANDEVNTTYTNLYNFEQSLK